MTAANSQITVSSDTTDSVFGTMTKNDDNVAVATLKITAEELVNPQDKSDILGLICHGTPARPLHTAGQGSMSDSELDPFIYFRKGNGTRPVKGGIAQGQVSRSKSSTPSSTPKNHSPTKGPAPTPVASNLIKASGAVKPTKSSDSSSKSKDTKSKDKAKQGK